MANLGAIGELADSMFVCLFTKDHAWSLPRNINPVMAVLVTDQAFTASFVQDFVFLYGSIRNHARFPVKRVVRALHASSGHCVAATQSDAQTGRFALRVPANMVVDLHVMTQDGDGCDFYYHDMPVEE